MQLGQLQTIEPDLIRNGVRIIAVSPDLPENLRESSEKHDLEYTLMSDSGMEAARACGLAFEVDSTTVAAYAQHGLDLEEASGETHHQLPVPAAFLLDKEGTVHFSYVNPNYKTRIAPELVMAAVKNLLDAP
ncbi:MAG: redoxin domain-containing protein [Candidatus Eisenbacteria bacterium]|nr:redoxin domain-containing protein [Candidatus Latescibacterota bacterium]MBD3301583.1 redoxin domain-containing protein [Candidatus Eisenbacteria bacterium]